MDIKDIGIGAALAIAYTKVVDTPSDKKIRQMVYKWDWLVNNSSPEKIADYYLPDAVLLPNFDSEILNNRRSIVQYFTNLSSQSGFRTNLSTESMVLQSGPTMAVASGTYFFFGDDKMTKARYTFVFKSTKVNGYKILCHHSSVDPE